MYKCFDCNREVSDSYGKKYLSNESNYVEVINGATLIRCPRCHIEELEKCRDSLIKDSAMLEARNANLKRDILSIKELVDEVNDDE